MIYSELYHLPTDVLLNELKSFFKMLLNDDLQVQNIMQSLRSAQVNFKILVSAIKLYKKVYKRRDKYLIEYNSKRITLEFYNRNQYRLIDTKLEKGYDHKSIFDKLEENKKNYLEYEKSVIRDIFYDNYSILLGCFIIACKMYNDISYTNDSWELVSNIECKRLNLIEKIILETLDYNLYFIGEEKVCNELQSLMSIKYTNYSSKKSIKKTIKKIFCF